MIHVRRREVYNVDETKLLRVTSGKQDKVVVKVVNDGGCSLGFGPSTEQLSSRTRLHAWLRMKGSFITALSSVLRTDARAAVTANVYYTEAEEKERHREKYIFHACVCIYFQTSVRLRMMGERERDWGKVEGERFVEPVGEDERMRLTFCSYIREHLTRTGLGSFRDRRVQQKHQLKRERVRKREEEQERMKEREREKEEE